MLVMMDEISLFSTYPYFVDMNVINLFLMYYYSPWTIHFTKKNEECERFLSNENKAKHYYYM